MKLIVVASSLAAIASSVAAKDYNEYRGKDDKYAYDDNKKYGDAYGGDDYGYKAPEKPTYTKPSPKPIVPAKRAIANSNCRSYVTQGTWPKTPDQSPIDILTKNMEKNKGPGTAQCKKPKSILNRHALHVKKGCAKVNLKEYNAIEVILLEKPECDKNIVKFNLPCDKPKSKYGYDTEKGYGTDSDKGYGSDSNKGYVKDTKYKKDDKKKSKYTKKSKDYDSGSESDGSDSEGSDSEGSDDEKYGRILKTKKVKKDNKKKKEVYSDASGSESDSGSDSGSDSDSGSESESDDEDYNKKPTPKYEKASYRAPKQDYSSYDYQNNGNDHTEYKENDDYIKEYDAYEYEQYGKYYGKQPEYVECTLKKFVVHTNSEHTIHKNKQPAEIQFFHDCNGELRIISQFLDSKHYDKENVYGGEYHPYGNKKHGYHHSKNYLQTLIAEMADYDDKKYGSDADYNKKDYSDKKSTYYEKNTPGKTYGANTGYANAPQSYDNADEYYNSGAGGYYADEQDVEFEKVYDIMKEEDKSEKASNILLKLSNLIAVQQLQVLAVGVGYSKRYITTIVKDEVDVNFSFNLRYLTNFNHGAFYYEGSETFSPTCAEFKKAKWFILGSKYFVKSELFEFWQLIHSLRTKAEFGQGWGFERLNNRQVQSRGNRIIWELCGSDNKDSVVGSDDKDNYYESGTDSCKADKPKDKCKKYGYDSYGESKY